MGQKSKFASVAIGALFCGLCITNAASAQTLPDGKGKAEFIHNCTACHRAELVVRVKKTPDEWRKSVDDMAARGTDGTKEDLDNVVLYLDTYFATDKPSPAATTPSTTPSSTSVMPQAMNATEIEHIELAIAGNGCFTCRRIDQQASHNGPAFEQLKSLLLLRHPYEPTYLSSTSQRAKP